MNLWRAPETGEGLLPVRGAKDFTAKGRYHQGREDVYQETCVLPKKKAHPHLRLLPPSDPADADRYPHEDDQARHDRKFNEYYDWRERMGFLDMLAPLITLVKGAAQDDPWARVRATLGLDPRPMPLDPNAPFDISTDE